MHGLWVYAPVSLAANGMGLLGLLGNPNNTRLYAAYSLASTNHTPPEGGARTGPDDPSAEITGKPQKKLLGAQWHGWAYSL
jgi:hypothetical protein